jgi:hypothetical protein
MIPGPVALANWLSIIVTKLAKFEVFYAFGAILRLESWPMTLIALEGPQSI